MHTGNREDAVLGETTHDPSAGGECVRHNWLQSEVGEELLMPCLFRFSFFFKILSQLRASN